MTLGEKLKEAARRAADISSRDDRLVTIKVRDYGYLVEGQREIGTGVRQCAIQLRWEIVDQHIANALFAAVESVNEQLDEG